MLFNIPYVLEQGIERNSNGNVLYTEKDLITILNIPLISFSFCGNVKLKGIIIIGDEGEQHPRVMKL